MWSAKGQRIRETYVNIPQDAPSLGVSLQWMPLSATEDVWHILEVTPNSPADLAGLLPYGDYVVGSPDMVLHGEGGLGQWIEEVCLYKCCTHDVHKLRSIRIWTDPSSYWSTITSLM